MNERVALISGVTGQDGAYLAELLLNKGYTVHGIKRRSSSFNTDRVDHLYQDQHNDDVRFTLHYGDMTDATNLIRVHSRNPSDGNLQPRGTEPRGGVVRGTGIHGQCGRPRRLADSRSDPHSGAATSTRFYQASTSELYGIVQQVPQSRNHAVLSAQPVCGAKLFAYWTTVNYREAYGLYACNGILFNHESPVRGETFVTRKITRAVARLRWAAEDVVSRQPRRCATGATHATIPKGCG